MAEDEVIIGHGTAQEEEFLSGLGSYSISGPYLNRGTLLKNYIAASDLRVNWGKMDRRRVVAFAKMKLAELESEDSGEAAFIEIEAETSKAEQESLP